MADKISFVIPCFNNEENIDDLFSSLIENESTFHEIDFEYVMVDDASEDNTLNILNSWKKKYPEKIRCVSLKKNIGSHKAVFKGLSSVSGDCVIVMAADLQDPPELSIQMVEEWQKGRKLVLAVKENQNASIYSKTFHFIMRSLFVKNAPEGAFDYVLFDNSISKALLKPSVKNCNLFYRLAEIEPAFSILYYQKRTRQKGKSGWTFFKKIFFFSENIVSYSLSKAGIMS